MIHMPPTASTRFRPPTPVGRWLTRPRMDALIDQVELRRLTLIHAPAGFGKSTVAAQWADELSRRGNKTMWFSLDDDDNRTPWFLGHLLECLRPIHPDLDESIFQILEERPEDAERFVVPLIINVVHQAEFRTVVVLDDWHVIDDERTQRALARLLEDSGDKLGLLVTSRTATGLPLTSLRVHDQVVEISPETLRFDEREARQFLVDVKGLDLSSTELTALHTKTEGWIAALQLTSLSLQKDSDVTGLLDSLADRQHGISDYLAENVLDRLDPKLLKFLLFTSVLDRVNPELATLLTGEPQSELRLEQVLFGDLFLQRLDDSGTWYRYHHLFRDFLRQRLERDHPEKVAELHSLAAHWFHTEGIFSSAVDHALLADEASFAASVVEEQALRLVEHSRMTTLLALVEKLPHDEIRSRSWLQLAIAWAHCLLHFPDEAFASLDLLAEAAAADPRLTAADRFRITHESLVVRECVAMYRDRVPEDQQLRREVLEEAERLHPWTVSVAANVVTFFDIHRGRGAEAERLQQWAHQYHRQVVGSFSEVYGDCFAGLIAFHNLEIALAQHHWTNAFRTACERSGRQSHAARLSLGLVGKRLYHRGEGDRAEELLEEALQLGQRAGVVDFMFPVYESLANIRAGRNDLQGAWDILEQGEQAGLSLSLPRLWSRMVTTKQRLGFETRRPTNPFDAADDHTDDQSAGDRYVMDRQRAEFEGELLRFDLARILHDADGDALARLGPYVEVLFAESQGQGNRFQALRDQILWASALEACGQTDQAEETMHDVIPDCQASGLSQPLLEGGPLIRQIAARLIADPESWCLRQRTLDWMTEVFDSNSPLRANLGTAVAAGVAGASRTWGTGPDEFDVLAAVPKRSISLSERERDILRLVDAGYTNREIAGRLYIGQNTVKWYLRKLYRMLGVSSREDCVQRAKNLQVLH
ncbi:LuxR family transcriptional regulator [Brevibacterium epidermidis]|uniref:LuxR family transcriptional regulator n=1 Tax=Brevibacterium epidermidis TaxID=1698 RepID=UPI000BF86AA8|nr:LuxR C-terminal-related transcriptional regulator [Brevibacterium epidermidis]